MTFIPIERLFENVRKELKTCPMEGKEISSREIRCRICAALDDMLLTADGQEYAQCFRYVLENIDLLQSDKEKATVAMLAIGSLKRFPDLPELSGQAYEKLTRYYNEQSVEQVTALVAETKSKLTGEPASSRPLHSFQCILKRIGLNI